MEGTPVELPTFCSPILRPQMILNGNSPFYNTLGYKVVKTSCDSVCVHSVASTDLEHLGKEARLTSVSETAGIPLRVPLDAVIDVGDMLHLLSVFWLSGNTPLVSSFLYQDCLGY